MNPDALAAACREFLEIWPLDGYVLEAYCGNVLVPALERALRQKQPRPPSDFALVGEVLEGDPN